MTDGSDERFIYDLAITIWHPDENVARVTREIGVEPTSSVQSGRRIRLQTGRILPQRSAVTFWSHTIGYKSHTEFFTELQTLLERLEAAQGYVRRLRATGGTVALSVHLAGQVRISDVLPAPDLARMARTGIGLEIWVFPEMRE